MRGGYGTSNHGTLADRAGVPSGPYASQVPGLMSKLDSFSNQPPIRSPPGRRATARLNEPQARGEPLPVSLASPALPQM